ncbi:Flagellar protein fliS [Providencia rettgeri]|uniref:Flagellar protein fliS n=1 Tax=Providencia rettgeri TaxID=587 RepID=A0A379FT81_PRORE|nr:Flagellar protein fliS [Providencia rettgeri]
MYQRHAQQAYQQVDLESEITNATPYQLIQILFKGALSALKRGEIFMQQGKVAEKGKEISKAIDIIDTGLKQSLNYEAGGELAENLASLYEYMTMQLLRAKPRKQRGLCPRSLPVTLRYRLCVATNRCKCG